jgi:transposase-like protein
VIDDAVQVTRTRRRRSVEEKLRIVLETLEPGFSVPVVARRHRVNANQLFIWRSLARADGEHQVRLMPVQIEP